MSIFDELIRVDAGGRISYKQWIEWNHFMIPNKPEILRNMMRKIMAYMGHCLTCTSLDGCYFVINNMPKQPLHPNCDCDIIKLSAGVVNAKVQSEIPIVKLTKYIFGGEKESGGKQNLFQSWGYGIEDSNEIKNRIEDQAVENYLAGNYVLKKLDQYGQRVAIPVNLKGKNFYSGWLLCPEGVLKNTTPFGGWYNGK